jgi:hypothetical protein
MIQSDNFNGIFMRSTEIEGKNGANDKNGTL